jgi:hypothetical protein
MIDSDGNGLLSWDECYEIVESTLSVFRLAGEDETFMDNLCKFFTDYIFLLCGFDISLFKNKGVSKDCDS